MRVDGGMADIQGTYDRLFLAVPNALAAMLDAGDAGGSVAVFVDGEPVVDVWGGYADADRTAPWERDTLVNVFSVTKTMTALCALVLVDRGALDPDAPVATYWPEFAAAGKDKVLVRHLLSHTAGLPDWDGSVEDLYDWPAATARLAARPPRWEPGTAAGYHSLTQGFLVGEASRNRADNSICRRALAVSINLRVSASSISPSRWREASSKRRHVAQPDERRRRRPRPRQPVV